MKLTPKLDKDFAIFLSLFSFFAIVLNFTDQVLLHLVATLGFALVLYWLYSYFSAKHKSIWKTVATALIIFLVLDFGTGVEDIIFPLLATFLAISFKFFLEVKKAPVVHPAAGSLLVMAAIVALIPGIANADISWWGAAFHPELALLFMVMWIAFDFYKWGRFPSILSFLAILYVLTVAAGLGSELGIFSFTTAPLYFLAALMLVDPKSSPDKPSEQIVFGLIAAVAFVLFAFNQIPHPELFAVVVASLFNLGLKWKAFSRLFP